jgi:hypothetical protein
MSDDTSDHLHRNIAAVVEYLEAANVPVKRVDTEDTWGDDTVAFELAIPRWDENELRGDGDE